MNLCANSYTVEICLPLGLCVFALTHQIIIHNHLIVFMVFHLKYVLKLGLDSCEYASKTATYTSKCFTTATKLWQLLVCSSV